MKYYQRWFHARLQKSGKKEKSRRTHHQPDKPIGITAPDPARAAAAAGSTAHRYASDRPTTGPSYCASIVTASREEADRRACAWVLPLSRLRLRPTATAAHPSAGSVSRDPSPQ